MLTTESRFVSIDLSQFHTIILDVLYQVADPSMFIPGNMTFTCNQLILPSEIVNIDMLAERGIPIFDYFIYGVLKPENPSINWVTDPSIESFDVSLYMKSIFAAYFLLMTRGKISLGEQETFPRFILDYLAYTADKELYIQMLSRNNISKMNHIWILQVARNGFPRSVRQRLSSGIAGCRYFNIIKNYAPINMTTLSPEVRRIYDLVKQVADNGPFMEMHPMFMPLNLASVSVSKNLANLIFDVYTTAEIENFVRNKALDHVLKFDLRYTQYRTWGNDTFSGFITKVDDSSATTGSNVISIIENNDQNDGRRNVTA